MKSFGDSITDIRVNRGWSLRKFVLKLKTISLVDYSKMERGIQNPVNKEMFDEIIVALEITDSVLIKELELLAMNFIPEKSMSESDLVEHFPAFLPSNVIVDDQLIEKIKETIIESNTPNKFDLS
jgi:transcriptional regulator with XRE-family HTH domain